MSAMISGALGRFKLALAGAGGPLLVAYMANGIGAVLRTVFDKLLETISVKDFGAKSDGVTDDSAAVVKANTRAGKRPLVFIGVSHIAAPTTITAPIADTLEQIFSVTSQVTIANGMPIRPEWFGMTAGNIRRAVNATPPEGGVILLADAVYPPSYDTATGAMFDNRGGVPGVDYMIKPHVRIQGSRLPEYSDDNSRLVNGSIIQGTFYVASEASGFQADLFGVDVGSYVVSTLYGGADHDGFCYLQANKAAPVYGKNVLIGTVRGLCSGDSSQAHACLFEAIDGGHIEHAEGRMANHGVVIKSRNITFGTLVGSLNHGEDVIIKSDFYANMENVTGDKVFCNGRAGGDAGWGLLILASTASAGTVRIASVVTLNKNQGMGLRADNNVILGNVKIGSHLSINCVTGLSFIGNVLRSRVGDVRINSSTTGVFVSEQTAVKTNSIGHLAVSAAVDALYIGGKLAIGTAMFEAVSGFVFDLYTSTARIQITDYQLAGVNKLWNLTNPLAGTWVQHGGGNSFDITPGQARVSLTGLVRGGTASTVLTLNDVNLRPAQPIRFTVLAFNGAAFTSVEILVSPEGVVSTSNFNASSGPGGYLSLDGVSWPMPF